MWGGDQVSNLTNKCAEAVEIGQSFGNYSRLKKKQFAIVIDEKKDKEGAIYHVRERKKNVEKKFIARILRFKQEGMLLALWKTGKISFLTGSGFQKNHIVEIRSNK